MTFRNHRIGFPPWIPIGAAVLLVAALAPLMPWGAPEQARAADRKPEKVWAQPADAKPLSRTVKSGLTWLVSMQQDRGGWGPGEVHRASPRGNRAVTPGVREMASLGDTCMASLALLRSGSSPSQGPHGPVVLRAVLGVCRQIEDAPDGSLMVTRSGLTARNLASHSRIQSKLGQYADTFLATLLLAEVRGKMPSRAGEGHLDAVMAKLIRKIEKNQKKDGSFGGTGWANALSMSLATKGINRYVQAGGVIDPAVLARLEKMAQDRYDRKSGRFAKDGSAGVSLYAAAANLAGMQDSANTHAVLRKALAHTIRTARTETERREARRTLERFDRNETELKAALRSVVSRLDDRSFLSGFGSNGGEEFLSYMNIAESLRARGGRDWKKWDRTISEHLARIQNNDGSWTGHHCITGRTFCTSAALLVLMADRTPIPASVTEQKRAYTKSGK